MAELSPSDVFTVARCLPEADNPSQTASCWYCFAIPSSKAGTAASRLLAAPAVASSTPREAVYRLLQQLVQPEWHSISDPTSPQWLAEFKHRVAQKETLGANPSCPLVNSTAERRHTEVAETTKGSSGEGAHAGAFAAFPSKEQFLLLNKITNRIDTPWVQVLRRLRAVEECEMSRPLELNDVINYAKRLAGSVAAPPETANIVDVVSHQTAFPSYHFLPYPSMEELQNSRLAALGTKPYADICFPPDISAKVVCLRRKAAMALVEPSQGSTYVFDTSLLSSDIWRDEHSKEVLYELRFTCATPCCTFWFSIASGQWSASQPLPRECPLRPLPSLRPLLVPGPFPKTVRVQCRKQGKKPSRFTQTCLKLKGTAAAWSGMPPSGATAEAREVADDQHVGPMASTRADEGSRATQNAKAMPLTQRGVSSVSQFHGLMLGASRRRGQQSCQVRSSESSSGSSSDED
ncbi:uncharacterized protein LOC34622543 [Cyclospora cayetanensis]|uniref:Uncharacterized protein LOC34622543 n=1 Tax=Cyclospora cayetanensis TaxID=88456 RepID=A0A6P6S0V7_9EIME|nr:uncharacterized protein LOC34622543 [Cyclospora cayetanensis]